MEKKYSAAGTEVYTYKNAASGGFHISLFLRAGSMYEDDGECGITHFLEHILVRNVNKIRGGELYSQLDEHGVEFNASTYTEMVQFYLGGAKKNFSFAADVILLLLKPIILTKSEIDTERRRIKAEIREADDKTSLSSFSQQKVFDTTSLSRSITGTNKSVDKISKSRLEEYRKRIFVNENMFFYVSGNYDENDLLRFIDRLSAENVKRIENPLLIRDNIAPVPQKFGKRDGAIYVKSADYTAVRFTFDIDMKKVGVTECDLIYDMLLSGYNSPFFVEMSEERGLFYDISGSVERYRNIGTIQFTFETREKNLYEAVRMSVEILNKFKTTPHSEKDCMKAGYVDNVELLRDDVRELNFTFAYDNHIMMLGYADLEGRAAAYAAVTPKRISEAACEIFRPSNLTLTLKGNKKKIDMTELYKIVSVL